MDFELKKAILITINYFDILDYAPSHFEIWKFLYKRKENYENVILALDELIESKKIESKNGFYFLPGKESLVLLRQKKYDISEKFWLKAIFAAKILNHLPFIKSIAISNTLALFNCDKNSDIDFFIITQKNKIWITRALSSILLHLLGLRRHRNKIAKRICLSFYISENKMDLQYTAKPENEFFMAFWIVGQSPIINRDKTFEKYKEANPWIKNYLPNSSSTISNYFVDFRDSFCAKIFRKILGFLFQWSWIEKIARLVQNKKIKKTQNKIGNPLNIIYNDDILKFHVNDWKRENSRDWQKLVKEL